MKSSAKITAEDVANAFTDYISVQTAATDGCIRVNDGSFLSVKPISSELPLGEELAH